MENEIKSLNDWEKIDNKLSKEFKFDNFVQAFSFVTKIAFESEKMNHHPDILISYNKVNIKLITHDINQIGENDIILARKIDEMT